MFDGVFKSISRRRFERGIIMGLSITAYRNIKPIAASEIEMDEDGIPVDDEKYITTHGMVEYTEKYWAGRSKPIDDDGYYTFDDSYDFYAGSYLGYNDWRDWLAKISDGKSFGELIDFSDCEGVIGSVASAKLYDDFMKNRVNAKAACGDYKERVWAMELYNCWTKAFKMARDNGAVMFY